MVKILYTGGGSGGPTAPLLALHDTLLQKLGPEQVEGLFLGTRSGPECSMVEASGMRFVGIPSGKLRRYFSWKNFTDPLNVLAGFFVGLVWLIRFKPQVVMTAGSFVSVPVAVAARLLGIPHLIYQMDNKPGLANRLMIPFSKHVYYLFDDTAKGFGHLPKSKIGPIVRSEVLQGNPEGAQQRFGLRSDKPVLVLTGGGQGAVKLNEALGLCLDFLLERFQVVHLHGRNNPPLDSNHPDYHPFDFISQGMGDLLQRADLVISRAGMGILSELALLGKDVILIPIPNSHQVLNVQPLAEQGGAALLPQQIFLEQGETWFREFFQTYQPGVLGQRLSELLPKGGNEVVVQDILKRTPLNS